MTDSPDMDLLVTGADNPELRTLPGTRKGQLAQPIRSAWQRLSWIKIGLFGVSLFLFILAITLMKESAHSLAPFVRNQLTITNPANSLGFGWLFAYVTMSGSPVAAAALTFFDGGAISELGAFMMITGSRLGGSFIVLLIGFIYVLRGHNLINSLDMGLLSLTITGSTYVVALVIGVGFLYTGILDQISFQSGALLGGLTDLIFAPIVVFFLTFLPRWALFLVGLVTIMISFSLFDRCLPQMTLKESQLGHMSRLVYRPWVMSHAPCPVIIVRGKVDPIQRILLCITGASSPSSHTLFVARLVSLLDEQSKITILHVMSQISAGPGARDEWQLSAGAAELIHNHAPEGELMKQDIQLLEQSPARISPKIRHGLVVEEISAEAKSGDYDLIVIGANQNRGWQRFLLDNLAHQIVVRTDRPVLVV